MRLSSPTWWLPVFMAMSSGFLSLGCGGSAGNPSPATGPSPTTGQPRAASTPTAVAKNAAAPASDSVNQAATAESDKVPAETADRTDSTEKPARQADEPQPEAARVKQAVELIDLRKFPRLNEARMMQSSPTHVWYNSRSSVAGATAFNRTEMETRGWKEVPKDVPANSEFADLLFTKDGFYARISIGATGDEGIVSVVLTNNGNVDARRLPKLPDAREIPVDPTNANSRVTVDLATVVDFCRSELAALGWLPYSGFAPDPTEVPHHRLLRFAKNAVRLDVSISDVSSYPDPQFPGAKTHVAYMLTGMLDHDLPIRTEATDVKLETHPWRLQYNSTAGIAELTDFYRSNYPKLGWKELEDASQTEGARASLIFRGPEASHFHVQIGERDNGNTVVQLTEVALEERPSEPVAATKPSEPPPPAAVVGADDKPKKTRKATDALGDTLAVPDGAKSVSRDSNLGMLMFNSDDDAKKIAEFYRKALATAGWREVKLASVVQAEFASLTFEKGDDTLTVAVLDGKPAARTRTIIQGDALWPETQPTPEPKPEKAAKARDAERPRLAMAKPRNEHQKLPNRGSIAVGDKNYTLDGVVAFQTKHGDDDVIAIVLSEKPVAEAKLQASLRKNPPDDDFAGFQPQVKLILNDSDQLTYFFLYADGLSINRGGTPDPEEVAVEATIGDGYASGKIAMKKPKEFFDKSYRFDASFHTKIVNAEAPAEPQPAPGQLVAEEIDGLPVPDNQTNRQSAGTQFRKQIQVTVPAELKTVLDFYRRELSNRGWKETPNTSKVEAEQARLAFAGPDGELSLDLERKGKDVVASMAVRYPAKAKAAGILPEPNRARLIIGNASNAEAVVVLDKKEHKVAAGVGTKDPKDGISVNLAPGNYTLTIKQRGVADQTVEINAAPNETWGLVILPDGNNFADALY